MTKTIPNLIRECQAKGIEIHVTSEGCEIVKGDKGIRIPSDWLWRSDEEVISQIETLYSVLVNE